MSRTAVLAAFAVLFALGSAKADVVVHVDKTSQRLSVSVDGKPLYEWPVSTARWGYNTPNGTYRPERLEKSWYSRKYDMSPMPHSIFFDGGYAIHGSYEVSHLRPARFARLHPVEPEPCRDPVRAGAAASRRDEHPRHGLASGRAVARARGAAGGGAGQRRC